VHTSRLTQVVKSIVESILPQETAQAAAQATLHGPGQIAESKEELPFFQIC
jgi:hypothetical protein